MLSSCGFMYWFNFIFKFIFNLYFFKTTRIIYINDRAPCIVLINAIIVQCLKHAKCTYVLNYLTISFKTFKVISSGFFKCAVHYCHPELVLCTQQLQFTYHWSTFPCLTMLSPLQPLVCTHMATPLLVFLCQIITFNMLASNSFPMVSDNRISFLLWLNSIPACFVPYFLYPLISW